MSWYQTILERERECHLNFFGKGFDLSEFEATLKKYSKEQFEYWKSLLLEPLFLPKVEMCRKASYPGFKIRPNDHAYEVTYDGKVLRRVNGEIKVDKKAHWLLEGTVLVDVRLKPAYRDGKQMWDHDNFVGPVIQELREKGEVTKYSYGPQSSRFGASADHEWEEKLKPALARKLQLKEVRFERAIEAVFISQAYPHMPRINDGNTDTWVWYEEYFEDVSDRVFGGNSRFGGLADVDYHWSDGHWCGMSLRPLAVL